MHVAPDNSKVKWLAEHPTLWAAFPINIAPCTPMPRRERGEPDTLGIKRRWAMITTGMKREGLVNRRTWDGDVHVPVLVLALRRTTTATPCDTCDRHRSCFVVHVHGLRSRRVSTRAVRTHTHAHNEGGTP